uniref:Uncharacterized protein n=1 Tax=Takifugu rubripes TaxID=31033 RepID=H2TFH0_TAKRU
TPLGMWDLIPGGRPKLHCGPGREAVRPGAAPAPARALGLGRPGPEVPEVDALVGGATMEAEVQVLVVAFLHRVHHLLRHPHGKGQVAAHLPHHHGGPDVPGLDHHVLPGNLLHHAQGVGAVALAAVLGAVREGRGQLVRLRVVHLLVHAFLEVLKDDCQLQKDKRGGGRGAPLIRPRDSQRGGAAPMNTLNIGGAAVKHASGIRRLAPCVPFGLRAGGGRGKRPPKTRAPAV